DQEMEAAGAAAVRDVEPLMEALDFSNALVAIWAYIGRANQYLERTSPWLLARDDANKPRLCTVLNTAAEAVRLIAYLVLPFMPSTAERIASQVGFAMEPSSDWARWHSLPSGATVGKVEPLFPRI